MKRRPQRSTQGVSSAASDVYKRQVHGECEEETFLQPSASVKVIGIGLAKNDIHDKQNNYEKSSNQLSREEPVSYTHLRAHETSLHLVCRLLLEKKKTTLNHTIHTIGILYHSYQPTNCALRALKC
eukprot:TRINITY_DN12601_c0_g1_i2.p1 TRINITY_DN12601_c0_g1~~TRINITY_DN12601_c0_g1_i2.p1  ORF type:complete len:126 (+),score=31.10 TRINITY_DN12601_c0_g1_i2:41-418(+)